jgi:hypothetical protein
MGIADFYLNSRPNASEGAKAISYQLEKRKNAELLPTGLDMKNIPQNEYYTLSGFPYSTT